jgi:transcriptional regulator with XRE-family HTH domain
MCVIFAVMEEDGHEADRTIAANLRILREGTGMSQAVLANRMRGYRWPWHATTVKRTESGEQALRFGELKDLAAILGVPVSRLITPGEEESEIRAASEARDSLRAAWAQTAKGAAGLASATEAARKALPAARSSRYPRAREMADAIESALAECTLESALREAGEP